MFLCIACARSCSPSCRTELASPPAAPPASELSATCCTCTGILNHKTIMGLGFRVLAPGFSARKLLFLAITI